jgi:large subunit ribosomal protein L9
MKIILLKDIPKLGKKYEVKTASDGHAVNMLIPRGFAIAATAENLRRFEAEKAKLEGERKVHEALLAENLKALADVVLTISGKASDKGHLFASLHAVDIAAELAKQARIQLDPSFIQLDHPIKEVGEHMIEVKGEGLPAGQAGKSVKFKVVVKAA